MHIFAAPSFNNNFSEFLLNSKLFQNFEQYSKIVKKLLSVSKTSLYFLSYKFHYKFSTLTFYRSSD